MEKLLIKYVHIHFSYNWSLNNLGRGSGAMGLGVILCQNLIVIFSFRGVVPFDMALRHSFFVYSLTKLTVKVIHLLVYSMMCLFAQLIK